MGCAFQGLWIINSLESIRGGAWRGSDLWGVGGWGIPGFYRWPLLLRCSTGRWALWGPQAELSYPTSPVTEGEGTKVASSASRGSASNRAGPAAKAATTIFLNFLFWNKYNLYLFIIMIIASQEVKETVQRSPTYLPLTSPNGYVLRNYSASWTTGHWHWYNVCV